mgnify:FL=1
MKPSIHPQKKHQRNKSSMAEDPEVLASRLNSVLNELKGVMQERKDRIEELRNQIIILENDNEDMEKRISELIMDAF